MDNMFANQINFQGNGVGQWNVGLVTTFESMFANATNFKEQNFSSSWITRVQNSEVDTFEMFQNAGNYNQKGCFTYSFTDTGGITCRDANIQNCNTFQWSDGVRRCAACDGNYDLVDESYVKIKTAGESGVKCFTTISGCEKYEEDGKSCFCGIVPDDANPGLFKNRGFWDVPRNDNTTPSSSSWTTTKECYKNFFNKFWLFGINVGRVLLFFHGFLRILMIF